MRRLFAIFDRINRFFLNFVNFIAAYGKSVKDGYKSNAFSPLVWLLVFLIPCLITVIFVIRNDIIRYVLVGLIVLLILFALLMYFLLFKRDPKLLQSEWYRLEDKKLSMIAEKGGQITISEVELNPKTQIGGGEDA
jgi:hypothetical protein